MRNKLMIYIKGNEYLVTPVPSASVPGKQEFIIETNCEYLFTIAEEGNYWDIVDKNVEPLDDAHIQQIGAEIEKNAAAENG
ncbi:hypothetical protein FRZ67_11460 [Panacibacter ginsenosidivorans]|uniref:Uncharacterized protein n=1 Tax=Panacibacter ginsenosidivorans TaxID=1813871 RepID=A0A5B8VB31_9BACT|nr:hypothetical protein [Panacibacter ginsenosidivorans]QEC67886.1 hypothetical protein FRZ67_11460 [Panacibacter ginsenosidivorans]